MTRWKPARMSPYTTARAPPPAPRTTAWRGIFCRPTSLSSATLKPGHVRVVPDEPAALARERVDRAGRLGLLGQLVDHRHDPLLVRDRDVRAEEVVAADLRDRVREGDRRAIPELVPGVDARGVEGGLLHRAGQRVRDGVADEDDPLAHDRILSRSAKKVGYEIETQSASRMVVFALGDEAGDRERQREPMIAEAVDDSSAKRRRALR